VTAEAAPFDALDAVLVAAHRCAALFSARAALAPQALPGELAAQKGAFRDLPATLSAHAWSGGGVGYARVVTIAGPELAIANVLGYPAPDRPLPILGIDLVAVAGTPIVVVADLSPTVRDHLDDTLEALARCRRAHPPLPSGGVLPAWCARWFSPHHLYTRVGSPSASAALRAALDFVAVWVDAAMTAPAEPALTETVAAAIAAYAADHLREDPGLRLLDRIFGGEWAAPFRETILFPSSSKPPDGFRLSRDGLGPA
jgi:hypothetical protein